MTDAEGNGPKCHRAVGMGHSSEDRAKAPVRPRDVSLYAAAEPGSVSAFGLACHQSRSWDATAATNLLAERPQRNLGARRQAVEILRQGVIVKADREDRLGPGFGHG
jgi:hypothetical protein